MRCSSSLLQDGVPETIALLREAGIKVWVLTGDKQETAISIGFSCLLLTQDMQQIIINESTIESCRAAIADAKRKYGILPTQKKRKWFSIKHQNSVEASIPTLNNSHYENSANHEEEEMERVHRSLALIIDGNSLVHALSKELEQDLFELATACRVVICCRVAPLQKAGIVSLVKRRAREMTLAVGDGMFV
jgi:phospholipid-transporting ATPase